jgi:mRNA-degrading endonuclease RelE of RelBE toxin-antitoxin system
MKVILRNKFKKKFKKLPEKVQNHFDERLLIFLENKFDQVLNNHSVEKVFPNCQSINVTGDYRAIYEECEDVAIFLTIDTLRIILVTQDFQ